MGDASLVPLPLSTKTVTLISGFSAGAKPVNQPCVGRLPLVSDGPWYSAVPVLPATRRPGILNHLIHGPGVAPGIRRKVLDDVAVRVELGAREVGLVQHPAIGDRVGRVGHLNGR